MRKSVSFLAVSLLFGTVACEFSTEDDDPDGGPVEGRDNGKVGGRGTPVDPATADGSTAPGKDASPQTPGAAGSDAGFAPDSAAATPPVNTPSTALPPEQCAAPVVTASAACDGPDLFEPNNSRDTAISLPSGCALVPGKLSGSADDDYYRFTTERADPVRVELAYEATATSAADPTLRVMDPMGDAVGVAGGDRNDLAEVVTVLFTSKRGFAYDVEVYDTNKACQGYNLRVDTNFCTDSFEDNDSLGKAAKGLVYGTKLDATVFDNDEDYFDLSSIQSNGASCTVTAALSLTSPAELEVRIEAADATAVTTASLSATAPEKTLTLAAGTKATALRVYSSEKVCSSYSVLCTPL